MRRERNEARRKMTEREKTEEWLKLLEFAQERWRYEGDAYWRYEPMDHYLDLLSISTGGWPSNEDLVKQIKENPLWGYYWYPNPHEIDKPERHCFLCPITWGMVPPATLATLSSRSYVRGAKWTIL